MAMKYEKIHDFVADLIFTAAVKSYKLMWENTINATVDFTKDKPFKSIACAYASKLSKDKDAFFQRLVLLKMDSEKEDYQYFAEQFETENELISAVEKFKKENENDN